MTTMDYIGLDVHKKTISYCVKKLIECEPDPRRTASTQCRHNWFSTYTPIL